MHQESRRGYCIRREITTVRKSFQLFAGWFFFIVSGNFFLTFVVFRPDEASVCLHALQTVSFYVRICSTFTPSYLAYERLPAIALSSPCFLPASAYIAIMTVCIAFYIDLKSCLSNIGQTKNKSCFVRFLTKQRIRATVYSRP